MGGAGSLTVYTTSGDAADQNTKRRTVTEERENKKKRKKHGRFPTWQSGRESLNLVPRMSANKGDFSDPSKNTADVENEKARDSEEERRRGEEKEI